MKNLFTIIFIVFLAAACDGTGWESEPVGTTECADDWDQAYDAGIADMSNEIERLQTKIEYLETENDSLLRKIDDIGSVSSGLYSSLSSCKDDLQQYSNWLYECETEI